MKTSWGSIAALATALVGLSGCVDTSPVDFVADASHADADAGSAVDAAALTAACQQCLDAGACQMEYAACEQSPKCGAFVNCLSAAYCLNYSLIDLTNFPACSVNCGAEAGISGQSDPSIGVFVPVILCAQNPAGCGPSCNVQGVGR
jgi:hypothetical protein